MGRVERMGSHPRQSAGSRARHGHNPLTVLRASGLPPPQGSPLLSPFPEAEPLHTTSISAWLAPFINSINKEEGQIEFLWDYRLPALTTGAPSCSLLP